ncbi:VP2 [Vicugna pacos bocaparvovirus]|nr:VP2 [Vicugna pacos bocaparvovirus]QDQ17568.1 VP2 [Vicugna pacos bocaparvovirus]
MEADQPMEEGAGDEPQPAAGGARAGPSGGPANASPGGVGISTGQWIGGAIFGSNTIVTRNTRQWWCPIRDDHLYKRYANGVDSTGTHVAYGYKTPWNYFNFNQYSSHFNPNEWQHLLNHAARFRPVKMTVKVYNIQIKQIVDQDVGSTLYQNDLTAGLHIFCDGSHQFPYTQNPWDQHCMPELPTQTWELPQYAYLTVPYESVDDNGTNAAEALMLRQEPLYMLESADHSIVRTGESVEFNFDFRCGWVDNTRTSQQPASMAVNPLVNSRLGETIRNNNNDGITQIPGNKKWSGWLPGPGINGQHATVGNRSASTKRQRQV